jgi:S1-C subfamily serine protease
VGFLDTYEFPFHEPTGRELHVTLTGLFGAPEAVRTLANRAQLDLNTIYLQQAPLYLWQDVLTKAAQGGVLSDLVREARDLLNPKSPDRKFFDELLAGGTPAVSMESPPNPDGSAAFFVGDDSVGEQEALLFRDDLTLQVGRVPRLIATLQRLLDLAPSVCRFTVDVHGAVGHGSGFRIAPDRLVTNWHVVHNPQTGVRATAVTAEFSYEDDGQGGVLTQTAIPCDVASIVTSQADDWAVITPTQPLQDSWPVIPLSSAVDPVLNEPAYIVQHPGGDRKRVGFVRNLVASFDDRVVHYLTDTQRGSSGSPVFNEHGQLIGLHHVGGIPTSVTGSMPIKKNEGIRIPRVVEGLAKQGVTVP